MADPAEDNDELQNDLECQLDDCQDEYPERRAARAQQPLQPELGPKRDDKPQR